MSPDARRTRRQLSLGGLHKVHKWLSVLAVAALLAWFVSGSVMIVPGSWRTLSPGLSKAILEPSPSAPPFEEARVALADAVATARAETRVAAPVSSVRLRRLPARLAYEITLGFQVCLIDAVTGQSFSVNESLARTIASEILGPTVTVGPVALQQSASADYRGPLPAYRVAAADGKGTVLYVNAASADVRYTDRLTRLLAPVVGLHEFAFLGRLLPPSAVRLVMLTFAILGISMSGAGLLILVAQFRAWRRRGMLGRRGPA